MKHLAPFLPPLIYTKTLMVVGMMLIVTKLSGNLQWPWAVVFLPFYAAHLAYALLTLGVLAWLRIDNWLQVWWAARYYKRLKRDQEERAHQAWWDQGSVHGTDDGLPMNNLFEDCCGRNCASCKDKVRQDATGLPGFLRESHDERPNVNAPPTYARPPMPPGPRIQVDLGDGRVLDHKQVGE